jgi:lysophospholipase L1-like esterase
MPVVLCFGDSNTWGWNPATKERHPAEVRWPGILRARLGSGWTVIEEGLNGRTTVWDDAVMEGRNGRKYLVPCLDSHRPVDVVILMLGTNDVKVRIGASPHDIARGAGILVELIQRAGVPRVILAAPPPLARLTEFAEQFEGGPEKSRLLPARYRAIAEERGCEFFDAGSVARCSDLDGVHIDAAEHRKLGEAFARILAGTTAG